MTARDRQAWVIASSLFVSLFLLWGSGYNTFPIFFPALLKYFGWSKAQLALISSGLSLSLGISAPFAGWVLDRIEARWVMGVGAALVVAGLVMASRADTFGQLLAGNVTLGVGLGASTVLPSALVISNWFGERRGMVLGLATAGMEFGGMCMTAVCGYIIAARDWRAAYLALSGPVLIVVMPLLLIVVRTRPQGEVQRTVAEATLALPGLEVSEAFRTRAFWMLMAQAFCYGFAVIGTFFHVVEFLIGAHYSRAIAVTVVSVVLGLAAAGKVMFGVIGDRIGGRRALALGLLTAAGGTLLLLDSRQHGVALVIWALVGGLAGASPVALVPLLQTETLGLRRFGTIHGLVNLSATIGASIGPVVVGKMADLQQTYVGGYLMCAGVFALASAASYACVAPASAAESIAPAGKVAAVRAE
jgi:MFS family permease